MSGSIPVVINHCFIAVFLIALVAISFPNTTSSALANLVFFLFKKRNRKENLNPNKRRWNYDN